MKIQRAHQEQLLGSALVGSLTLRDNRHDLLFAALILTAIGVFFGGNLLLIDLAVLSYSAPIAVTCLGVLFVFYTLARILRSLAWGLVLTYGLLWALVYIGIPGVHIVLYGVGTAAFLYTIRYLRVERGQWVSVLLMAVIGTATVLGVERAYTSFDILPRLHSGMVGQDTLFHVSIAAMIKNYGVVSTGLHGLVEIYYHAFSHVLMAGISLLAGRGVLETYGVASWVLFAPLLIFAVTSVCALLDRDERLSLPLAWGIAAFLLVLFPRVLSLWAFWDSFFVSESYLVSLGLFLLGLGILFKRSLRFSDLALVALLALGIGAAKASVGLIFVGLWFVRLVFVSGTRRVMDLGATLLAATSVFWVVLDVADAASGGLSILPFHFVSYSLGGEYIAVVAKELLSEAYLRIGTVTLALMALASFWLFHFSASWVIIGRTIRQSGVLALFRSPVAVYSLAAVLAGSVIVILFSIPGGSAYYFSNVAFFVSFPGLVGLATFWVQDRMVGVEYRWVLGIGIVCVSLMSLIPYYKISGLGRASLYNESRNLLIEELTIIRKSASRNEVLTGRSELMAHNPVSRCTAQPFVYPAVSERPWTDVIRSDGPICPYRNYGYEQYGVSEFEQDVKSPVRLLRGMQVQGDGK